MVLDVTGGRGRTGPNEKGKPYYEGAISTKIVSGQRVSQGVTLHKGVRESDFGPVDGTIAGCFDEGQVIGILGIENDFTDGLLFHFSGDSLHDKGEVL